MSAPPHELAAGAGLVSHSSTAFAKIFREDRAQGLLRGRSSDKRSGPAMAVAGYFPSAEKPPHAARRAGAPDCPPLHRETK